MIWTSWVSAIVSIVTLMGLGINLWITFKVKCNDLKHVETYLLDIKGDMKEVKDNIIDLTAKVAKIEGRLKI